MSTANTSLEDARAAAALVPNPAPGSWVAYLHAALAEVDRLTELLAAYRVPLPGGPSQPRKPDPTYERMEATRAEAEKGYTDYEPFVGMVLCPARDKCTAGLLAVFKPLADGQLPMHRHETFGHPCEGARKKPVTPPLQLRPPTPPADDDTGEKGAAYIDVTRAARLSFGVRKVDPSAATDTNEQETS